MTTPQQPQGYELAKKKKPWYKKWWIWAIVIIVLAGIGTATGGGDEDNTASETTTPETEVQAASDAFDSCQEVADAGLSEITDTHPRWNPALDADGNGAGCETTPATEEITAAEESEEATPATSTSRQPAPGRPEPHPECQPNDTITQMIPGVLNDQSQTVTNGQIIEDGDDTWIGVTLMDADGKMESRSDVWLLRDGGLYAVSGGARNGSWAISAPGVSMADEYAQGVDACVVAASLV